MPLPEKTVGNPMIKSLQWGMHDAIVNGEIVRDIPDKMVYVSSQSELANFSGEQPGTIAALYGFGTMWQLKPDGTWVSM